MLSVISWGTHSGLGTSSAAPSGERLRIVQSILPPSNSIDAALKTRCLGIARLSCIASIYAKILRGELTAKPKAGSFHKYFVNQVSPSHQG